MHVIPFHFCRYAHNEAMDDRKPSAKRITRSQTRGSSATGSATRTKNKVSSPKPAKPKVAKAARLPETPPDEVDYSSDDFEYDDQEDLASAPTSAAGDESDTSAGSRKKLALHLQHQLLADINKRGGLDKFGDEKPQALALLCDGRDTLYGQRGSSLHVRIGRKVARWKEEYKKGPIVWGHYCLKHGLRNNLSQPSVVDQQLPVQQEDSKPPAQVSFATLPKVAAAIVATKAKQQPLVPPAKKSKSMNSSMRKFEVCFELNSCFVESLAY